MPDYTIQIILAVIAAFPGIYAIFAQIKRDRQEKDKHTADQKKTEAETTDIITDAAGRMVKALEARIKTLEIKVRILESENIHYKERNEILFEWGISLVERMIDAQIPGIPAAPAFVDIKRFTTDKYFDHKRKESV
ncbi:MAG: hypothetical protein DRP52_01685 [Planctomycetota bacterium]|nr:MAG: hypothetical protein DRP52_01685 [Planctomycetota bacterium]